MKKLLFLKSTATEIAAKKLCNRFYLTRGLGKSANQQNQFVKRWNESYHDLLTKVHDFRPVTWSNQCCHASLVAKVEMDMGLRRRRGRGREKRPMC